MHAIAQVEEEHDDEYLPPQKSFKRSASSISRTSKRLTPAFTSIVDQVCVFI
jgi:hypothetical protein